MWTPFAAIHRLAGPTWAELIAAYYASPAFRGLSPSSQAPYRRVIDRWLTTEGLGSLRVRALTRAEVEAMLARRTPGSANDLLKKIRILTRFALERQYRRDDPTLAIRRYPTGEGHHTWTETEIAQFEAHWPAGTTERLAFALLLYTGQRRSDVVRMGWGAVVTGRLIVRQRKTKAELLIPLHPVLLVLLPPQEASDTFLLTPFGKPFTSNGFGNWMARKIGEAGLPDRCVTHGLRKAAARRLAEAGCTANEIAAITGHRTLREVERYTRGAEQARLAERALGRIGSQ